MFRSRKKPIMKSDLYFALLKCRKRNANQLKSPPRRLLDKDNGKPLGKRLPNL